MRRFCRLRRFLLVAFKVLQQDAAIRAASAHLAQVEAEFPGAAPDDRCGALPAGFCFTRSRFRSGGS